MKIIFIIFFITLAACSKVTSDEESLIGYWQWSFSKGEFKETGFVELNDDKSYSYKIISTNSTENISVEASGHPSEWRLRNGKICIATSWQGATWFSEGKVIEEVCLWEVQKTRTGEPHIFYTGGLSKNIRAIRKYQ